MLETHFSDENFFVIKGFMSSVLGLSGTERECYAIIYGFNTYYEQDFFLPISYLIEATCASKRTIISVLKSLTEKELIFKNEYRGDNGASRCSYRVNYEKIPEELKRQRGAKPTQEPGVNTDKPGAKNVERGAEIAPNNNIYNNIYNNKTLNDKAHTHEEFFEELTSNTSYIELAAKQNGITREKVLTYISQYRDHLTLGATVHTDRQDFLRHFRDWLRIKVQQDGKSRPDIQDRRRSAEISATSAEDYKSGFLDSYNR